MKIIKNIAVLICIITSIVFTSCNKRLDANLYNNAKLTEYKFDKYDGDVDFKLDDSYTIPDSLIHLIPLASQDSNETSATTIYGVYIGHFYSIKNASVILYLHGNKSHMDFYWQRAKLLANAGGKNHYGVLMIDYRGFGMSQGTPTEKGMYADADAAVKWLKSKGVGSYGYYVYGFSLGSAPACELAINPRTSTPGKLMLEAPFASASTLVDDASGTALPPSYYTDARIDNVIKIKRIQQPFLMMQGVDDKYLKIETNGDLLYSDYTGTIKQEYRVAGAGHSDVPLKLGFVTYCNAIDSFIRK